MNTAPSLAPGVVIQDTYEIVRCVGRGGMGEVYEAKHRRLSGRYAVKLLIDDVAASSEAFARFQREAQVTSELRHPNIVQVVDFNRTPEGAAYLVMEFLDGEELTDVIARDAPMAPARVVALIDQIASALEAAHGRGVVHRDLKPQNVILVHVGAGARRTELIKVMDFGISKVREATSRLTREQVIMGTPQYMAPEQAQGRGEEIDSRTDQFPLAAIAYEMLSGRAPFQGDNVQAVLYQVVHEVPPSLTSIARVDPRVAEVVARGLAKRRADRFPTIAEFATALGRAVAAVPGRGAATAPAQGQTRLLNQTMALPAPTTGTSAAAEIQRTAPPRRRRLWPVLAVVLAGGGAATGWLVLRPPASEPGPAASESEPAPAREPARAAETPTPTPTAAATAHADTVRISLRDPPPPGLQVTVDGLLADMPFALPHGPQVHELRFDASGYESYSIRVDGTQDRQLVLPMRKLAAAASTRPTRAAAPARVARAARKASAETPPATPPASDDTPPPSPKKKLITDF